MQTCTHIIGGEKFPVFDGGHGVVRGAMNPVNSFRLLGGSCT